MCSEFSKVLSLFAIEMWQMKWNEEKKNNEKKMTKKREKGPFLYEYSIIHIMFIIYGLKSVWKH